MAEDVVLGIDLSRWQSAKPFPWAALKIAGVHFSIHKATHGASGVDPAFIGGFKGARSAAILRGAYHWFLPQQDPVKQAEHYVSTVRKAGFDDLDLVAIDFEDPNMVIVGKDLADRLMILVEAVEQALDKPAVIYTGNWFWKQYMLDLDDERAASRLLWHSQYPRFGLDNQMSKAAYESAMALARDYRTTVALPWRKRGIQEAFFQFDGDRGLLLPNGVDADFNIFRGSLERLEATFACRLSQGGSPTLPAPTLLSEKPQESVVLGDFLHSLATPEISPSTCDVSDLASKISCDLDLLAALRAA